MRKVDDGEEKEKRKKKKRMAFLVATTSLSAVYRPNDDRWNAARSCQKCCLYFVQYTNLEYPEMYKKGAQTRKTHKKGYEETNNTG